jgi:hypothetical protein
MATTVGELLGQEIAGVAFGRDGIEFRFATAVVRSAGNPCIVVGQSTYCFPKAGSRDALCLVIGSTVETADLVEGRHFEFTTSNGCRVRIPLKPGTGEAQLFGGLV